MRRTATGSGAGLLTSQKDASKCPNNGAEPQNEPTLYQKCLICSDYGVTCNGPKLAAMEDIMVVRAFHREIRNRRSIPMKLIYLASQPVSESTINDYFSHSEKDFKWTTVACIDNGLTAICGNRVGQPPLDHPCPATSSEIRQQREEAAGKLAESEAECQRLMAKLTDTKGKHIDQLDAAQKASQKTIDYLKGLVEYLKDTAQKRYDLLLKRDRVILILSLLLIGAVLVIGTLVYIIWELTHPGSGLFQW